MPLSQPKQDLSDMSSITRSSLGGQKRRLRYPLDTKRAKPDPRTGPEKYVILTALPALPREQELSAQRERGRPSRGGIQDKFETQTPADAGGSSLFGKEEGNGYTLAREKEKDRYRRALEKPGRPATPPRKEKTGTRPRGGRLSAKGEKLHFFNQVAL